MAPKDPVVTTTHHFAAKSPAGRFYQPLASLEEARDVIAARSRFEGEPGWQVWEITLYGDSTELITAEDNRS